jgi:hypothetical protein
VTCAYGASVKPGISPTQNILVDRSLWEAVTGAPSSWFDWLLGIIPNTYITASDLCALNLSDPVLPPVSTLVASFFRDPTSIQVVFNYIRDKLRYSAFANACVCNPSGTWTTYAVPPCEQTYPDSQAWTSTDIAGGLFQMGWRFTANVSCVCVGLQCWFLLGATDHIIRLWDNATSTLLQQDTVPIASGGIQTKPMFSTPVNLVAGASYTVTLELAVNEQFPRNPTSGEPHATTMVTPVQSVYNYGTGYPVNASGGYPVGPLVCPGSSAPTPPSIPTQPTGFPVPPPWTCTTVGDVCIRLQQLAEKIDWLIRTQPAPLGVWSVAESTVHSGLTGHGTLTVSGILGVRVLLTTVPASYGSTVGSPTRLLRVGRIDWSTAEGWVGRAALTDTPQAHIPVDPLTTTIGYSLSTGVVATIIELTRGP